MTAGRVGVGVGEEREGRRHGGEKMGAQGRWWRAKKGAEGWLRKWEARRGWRAEARGQEAWDISGYHSVAVAQRPPLHKKGECGLGDMEL